MGSSNNSTEAEDLGCWIVYPPYDFEFPYGVIGTTFAVCGLFGNSVSIIVLSHARLCSTTTFLLRCLAAFNSVLLFSDSIVYTLTWVVGQSVLLRLILGSCMFIVYPIATVSQTGTIYTMVVLSVERYMAVVRPLHAKAIWTKKHARRVAIAILVWSLAYNFPRFLEYSPKLYWDESLNQTWLCSAKTDLQTNKYYTMFYLGYVNLFVEILLPVFVMSVLHARLLRILRKRRCSDILPYRLSSVDENRLTAIVTSLTFVLFCSQMVVFIYNILQTTLWDKSCPEACYHFHHVTIVLHMVNSASNFIFYCVIGRSFRKILLLCFFCQDVTPVVKKSFKPHKYMVTGPTGNNICL